MAKKNADIPSSFVMVVAVAGGPLPWLLVATIVQVYTVNGLNPPTVRPPSPGRVVSTSGRVAVSGLQEIV